MKHNPYKKAAAREGTVLVTCLILMSVLSFVAASLLRLTIPDVSASGYHKRERVAFYNAEAGVQYVVNKISEDMASGTLTLSNAIETVAYSAPAGYDFGTVTTLSRLPDGYGYMFTVTGHYENAKVVIEASAVRPRMFRNLGIFGDQELQLQPNIEVYSYDSRVILNPVVTDSTGEANSGSNESIVLRPGAVLDGLLFLGEDILGVPPPSPAGADAISVGRIEPDPLGAVGGPLAAGFAHYSQAANNDNATAGIAGNAINVGNGDTMTLSGGHYYLTDLYLATGSTLEIDASPDDPVIIYLHGPFRSQPNNVINYAAGRPSNFFIFCDTTDELRIQPNNDFRGFVYAPYADLKLQPNGELHGVFWGDTALLQPGNVIYIDVSLLDQFRAKYVCLYQWRQIVNDG